VAGKSWGGKGQKGRIVIGRVVALYMCEKYVMPYLLFGGS